MKKPSILHQVLCLILLGVAGGIAPGQVQPPLPPPDSRFKADILVIVAHPDDDTAASTYMAKAVLDEGKRVAVIFTNRGRSGPNAVGTEQGKALADVREMEARHSLAARGVNNVWFLDGQDTPTQDVLHSLETLGHGKALEEVMRLVRLTRPEVILTWMPAYVAGENHGDHQAAGVLAVEAFDEAGDPTAFPEQVTPPRNARSVGNYGEGLRPWQAEKLYFFSDATHPDFLKGHGPTYLATEISPARKISYAQINREAWEQYATQLDFDENTLRYFTDMPEHLVLGKSLVQSKPEADVWTGVVNQPIDYVPLPVWHKEAQTGVTLTLGGPWAFYREFYRRHDLASLEGLVPPQTSMSFGGELWVPLLLQNGSSAAADLVLHADLPKGWTGDTQDRTYRLKPGETYPIQLYLKSPQETGVSGPQRLHWTILRDGQSVGEVKLDAYDEFDGVSQ